MVNRIMAMGLEVDVDDVTGMLDVRGENDKLQSLRQILDEEGYVDDTAVACGMFGKNLQRTSFRECLFVRLEKVVTVTWQWHKERKEKKDMTKMEYAQEIAKEIGGVAKEVEKNNGVKLIGISLENKGISPCVYIDSMYEQGMTIGEATAEVKEIMDANPAPTDFAPEMLTDFAKAKQYLELRLYNANNKYEISKSAAEYGFDDLIIIPVLTGFMPNASVKVDKSLIKTWGVSEEEVFSTAKENMNVDDYEIIDMNEMLKMFGAPVPEDNMDMYVLSNKDRIFGAIGAIVLRDKLKEMFPNGYTIIPSSVHEVIVIPYTDNKNEIEQIINEVNTTEVAPDEVLSNKPYVFI